MNYAAVAKLLIAGGVFLIILGVLFFLFGKLGITGFRLPGDIYIRKENISFYFPVVSCILLSIVLTIIFNLFSRR